MTKNDLEDKYKTEFPEFGPSVVETVQLIKDSLKRLT
jgi:hypothetical protein